MINNLFFYKFSERFAGKAKAAKVEKNGKKIKIIFLDSKQVYPLVSPAQIDNKIFGILSKIKIKMIAKWGAKILVGIYKKRYVKIIKKLIFK